MVTTYRSYVETFVNLQQQKVSYHGNIDRRLNNGNTPADITDDNIDDRIAKFPDVINSEKVYRILFRYFFDLGKINYPIKINFKITSSLKIEIKRLLNQKKKSALVETPDAKIIFRDEPCVQYKQF